MVGARTDDSHAPVDHAMRRVVVATELRAHVLDGVAWVPRAFAHDYWSSFLGVPTATVVVLRGEPVRQVAPELAPLEGPLVRSVVLPPLAPSVSLPTDLALACKRLWRLETGVLVLRMPGVVGSLVLLVALARRRRFAVQMVGDPLDVAFKGGIGGRPGQVAGMVLAGTAALACRTASAVSYVTDHYLQRRYPPRPGVPARAISDVVLDSKLVGQAVHVAAPPAAAAGKIVRIVTVASLEQRYKRLDLLLEAAAALGAQGWAIDVQVIGGGRLLEYYRRVAANTPLTRPVIFHGMLDHTKVIEALASADLFVLCSDTEGMPRAMIEAMAVGTPCVGSAVGGIPELLPAYALFKPGSVNSLVSAIGRHLNSPTLLQRSARDMLQRAQSFDSERLQALRREFAQDLVVRVAGNVHETGCRY